MWNRYQPYGGRGPRHMRGIYGFPWIFVFFLVASTGFWQWLILGVALMIIIRLIMSATGAGNTGYQQPYYQPPYQASQPYQAPYQPPEQGYTPYQPYQQGYQAAPATPQPYQPVEEQEQTEQYQEYEQPQAEYPQEMPPMS